MSDRGGAALSLRDGEYVFHAGESDECVYVVVRGGVQLRTEGALVATVLSDLRPGDVFGRISDREDHIHTSSAVAVGSTELAMYDRAALGEAIREQPELALEMITSLTERVSTASEQLQELSKRYVLDRTEMALIERAVLDSDEG